MYDVNHDGSLFGHGYSVVAPAVSGTIAFCGLKPHRLHGAAGPSSAKGPGQSPDADSQGRAWGFLIWLVTAFCLWLGVGFAFFPADRETQPTVPSAPAASVAAEHSAGH